MTVGAAAQSAGGAGATVLGLHFGHDAAATVIRSGRIASYVSCERMSRIKHRLGLDLAVVETTLRAAGVGVPDIDAVAVSSTQSIELLVDDPTRLTVRYRGHDEFGRPFAPGFAGLDHAEIATTGERSLARMFADPALSHTYVGQFFAGVAPKFAHDPDLLRHGVPWIDYFWCAPEWESSIGLRGPFDKVPDISDRTRYGFHVPIEVTIDGVQIPGYAVHHQLAHAACSYYQSGFRQAAILTHDGFSMDEDRVREKPLRERVCSPGMYFFADDEAIYPLLPNALGIGFLYEHVSTELGLGVSGGPGKLMGLAAYGRPRFFDDSFVGNHHDFRGVFDDVPQAWLDHCVDSARRLGYDLAPLSDPERITESVNVDIAASTQLLLEQIRLAATESLRLLLGGLGRDVPTLCLSGGTALNCPSNSRIASAGCFDQIFVEPMCDDGGIAIGAALAVHHNILGHPLRTDAPATPTAYLGVVYPGDDADRALAAVADRVTVEPCTDSPAWAAQDLAENRLVAWYDGGSEAGPRALGHRSLLADPRPAENWPRVNRVKGRETWRPLAPSVLREHTLEWFKDVPVPSPYMLFNAEVAAPGLAAVTHVDGSARIQTVDESHGAYRRLIQRFFELTGVPVVLNTSLNGPGEPIVERPAEAVALFLRQDIDVLYLAGRRVTRSTERATGDQGKPWNA